MIEKMKFLSITGPKADIDRVIEQYLSRYEIHLENAMTELKTVSHLKPYLETNPYKGELQAANQLVQHYGEQLPADSNKHLSLEDAVAAIHSLEQELNALGNEKQALQNQVKDLRASMNQLIPFTNLNYDVSTILHFQFVRFRFGRIPHEYFEKFMRYIYDTIDTVVHKCQEDSQYVWLVYFVPHSQINKIDAIYSSMHFERFYLPDEYQGTPMEAAHALDDEISGLKDQISFIDDKISKIIDQYREDLVAARKKLTTFSLNFDVRKLAACTEQDHHSFYILCGWMTQSDAKTFHKDLEDDANTFCFVEDNHGKLLSKPPTKLRNPGLFRPFEMFIKMYGLPSYNEIDPTMILGLTYSFLFGFMFGDVGQGLCLLVGGYLLFRFKKMSLAAIISCCGFFSTLFGFLFGSVFGFEHLLEPLWLRPKEAMTQLPFIGNLNTVFIVAVALGMGIVLMTMICNVINNLRTHNTEKWLFDTNGVAGMVFYAALVGTVFLYMTGRALPATFVLVIMFLLPLLAIFFKEPLTALVEKKAEILPKEKGMFVVQGCFELFEVLLSYFSNTLSFVRVGAFAVSHAAMMEVVLMLSGAEAGTPNWIIIILGNLFVCGMEGLIVGIQVLRLEYYELFSRFYSGSGRAFIPYGKQES